MQSLIKCVNIVQKNAVPIYEAAVYAKGDNLNIRYIRLIIIPLSFFHITN